MEEIFPSIFRIIIGLYVYSLVTRVNKMEKELQGFKSKDEPVPDIGKVVRKKKSKGMIYRPTVDKKQWDDLV